MSSSIIAGLRDFMLLCPALGKNKINIDYLPEDTKKAGVEYSIDASPCEEIMKRYIGGAAECQFQFMISSVKPYSADTLQQMENSGLFEAVSKWLDKQTNSLSLPDMPSGLTATSIKAVTFGYLAAAYEGFAKYVIQCVLYYDKEGDR